MESEVRHIYSSAFPGGETGPVDVVVTLKNGERYVASFIPHGCIDQLLRPHADGSSYFWSKNLILVKDCHSQTVERVVKAMVEDGDLREAFGRL